MCHNPLPLGHCNIHIILVLAFSCWGLQGLLRIINCKDCHLTLLKDGFCSSADPYILISTAPEFDITSQIKQFEIFQVLWLSRYFLFQSTVSCSLNSSSEVVSSCCHKSNAWSLSESQLVLSAQKTILQITR